MCSSDLNRDAEEATAGLRHRREQRCQSPPAGERVASLSRFHHVATLRADAPSTVRQATRHATVTTVRLDTRSPAGACRSTLVALATVTRGSLLCVAVKRSMGDITMEERACGRPNLCRTTRAFLGGPFRKQTVPDRGQESSATHKKATHKTAEPYEFSPAELVAYGAS